MVGCRPSIVEVDGDRDGCMVLKVDRDNNSKMHEAPVKFLK